MTDRELLLKVQEYNRKLREFGERKAAHMLSNGDVPFPENERVRYMQETQVILVQIQRELEGRRG